MKVYSVSDIVMLRGLALSQSSHAAVALGCSMYSHPNISKKQKPPFSFLIYSLLFLFLSILVTDTYEGSLKQSQQVLHMDFFMGME